MKTMKLATDPAEYGSKGQAWSPDFVEYMVMIVTHPTYEGMPDAIKDDGKIQWEAPSNRASGKYQNTHHKRRDWWRNKAESIGVNTNSGAWISETAKKIHPTGEKVCKRCGKTMQIAYVYPNSRLTKRIASTFGEDFECDFLESITEIIQLLYDNIGPSIFKKLPKLLSTGDIDVPYISDNIDDWLIWIEEEYVPREPSLLSPGAMSNAPDRFDGFHSFNLCCRKKADTGRHDPNMRSYTTDRRVFEYWSDGDWIAADRLMGLIGARFRNEKCADGGDGPCSADHVGPLSLGFMHRPEFRLLSKAANSSKNNRMTFFDVQHLKKIEQQGIEIVSWYAKSLWDRRKKSVVDEETSLRLSKLMRDNQRNAMKLLAKLFDCGSYTFLASLLSLDYADNNVEFENLAINNYLTTYNNINYRKRTTKYASKQKSRRIRIGFNALQTYARKENRHFYSIEDKEVNHLIDEICYVLSNAPEEVLLLDKKINNQFNALDKINLDENLRQMSSTIQNFSKIECFLKARELSKEVMNLIGSNLSELWDSDRYVRAAFSFEDN